MNKKLLVILVAVFFILICSAAFLALLYTGHMGYEWKPLNKKTEVSSYNYISPECLDKRQQAFEATRDIRSKLDGQNKKIGELYTSMNLPIGSLSGEQVVGRMNPQQRKYYDELSKDFIPLTTELEREQEKYLCQGDKL
jgi:hypothetical protein